MSWQTDDFLRAGVEYVLINGHVILHEQKQDTLWRVEGSNIDGEKIQVVVAVNQSEITVKIVTTF